MVLKKLFSDVAALYVAHGAKYLFILVTLPYLARILGPESFGVLLFYQSLGFIIGQAVEYGFAYNGTRIVSQSATDKHFLSRFLGAVLTAQVLVFVVSLSVISVLALTMGLFAEHALLFWTLMASLFQSISLNWFMRGIGRAVLVAKLELLAKAISLALLFLIVNSEEDIHRVMFAFFAGSFIVFLISLILFRDIFSCRQLSFSGGLKIVIEGWNAFLVRAGGSIIGDGNVLVASALLNPVAFGLFAGVYRVIGAIRGLFVPLVDAVFPFFTKHAKTTDVSVLVKRFAPILLLIGLGLSSVIYLFAELIIKVLLGDSFLSAVELLQVFSILPTIIAVVHGFGTQWLVALGKENIYSKIVLFSGTVSLLMNYFLTPIWNENGVVGSILMAYTLIAVVTFTLFANRRRMGL